MSVIDKSTKLFNTAVISTKIPKLNNSSSKLNTLIQSKAFTAVLESIHNYAKTSGLPEEQAAEEVIQVFREIDSAWDDYIFQEGLDRLKGHLQA